MGRVRSLTRLALVVGVVAACASNQAGRSGTSSAPATATTSASLPATAPITTGAPSTTSTTPAPIKPTTTAPPSPPSTLACVDPSGWSTARLAAETVIVPALETDLAAADSEVAAGAGGVLLMGSAAPADLGAQVAALKSRVPGGLGLLVMTDEEGGGIQRMANLVGSLPWASYMGEYWSPAQITAQVAAVARRMAGYGVNVDLAPVVDVDGRNIAPGPTDPDGWRSFSGDTAVVSADGAAYAQGLAQGGVIAVLKHFPGLGGASGNTDTGPAHTLPWSTLRQSALPPFVAAIEDDAPAVMVSNASVPGLSTLPAALSPVVIQQELVGALHFGGLVITDSLTAQAISAAGYSLPAAAAQALRAGADMVMYVNQSGSLATNQQFQQITAAITSAVAVGSLSRGRLVSAARVVLRARHLTVCRE